MFIENEKKVHPKLCEHAREYCKNIGASGIYNICYLGEGDYRIMYYVGEGEKRKMCAVILKMPEL